MTRAAVALVASLALTACGPIRDDSSVEKLRAFPEAGQVVPGAVELQRTDRKATQDDYTTIITLFGTSEPVEEVVQIYSSELLARGWALATQGTLTPIQSRIWQKTGYQLLITTSLGQSVYDSYPGFATLFSVEIAVTTQHPP
jgi:hypothetical protein